jgi:hypothetical protein
VGRRYANDESRKKDSAASAGRGSGNPASLLEATTELDAAPAIRPTPDTGAEVVLQNAGAAYRAGLFSADSGGAVICFFRRSVEAARKHLKQPLFLASLCLFLSHQVLQKMLLVRLSWADAYLDPLLAMPLLLPLLQWERSVINPKRVSSLTPVHCWLVTLYVAFVSEWIFPFFSANFTTDPLDVILFFAGTGLYVHLSLATKLYKNH